MLKLKSIPILAGSATLAAAAALSAGPASAGTLVTEAGTVLTNYAVVSVGPNASLNVNSGPITGNVLIGDGSNATSSGGGNGQVTGVVDVDGTQTGDNLQNLQTKPTVQTVSTSVTTAAFNAASNMSSSDAALAANQTFTGTLSSTTTINAAGALTVVDFDNIHNALLTIDGSANDIFVFNVSGEFQTNVAMTLSGGVTANHILWNFTGTSGQVLNTSGGNELYGTFLATDGGDFQFSSLDLVAGQLINTDGYIQFVSNSSITAPAPFVPAPPIGRGLPVLLAVGGMLFGSGFLENRKKRHLPAA